MTAHELARELLKCPDVPMVVSRDFDGYEKNFEVAAATLTSCIFNGFSDTKEVPRDENDRILPRPCMTFDLCAEAPESDRMAQRRAEHVARIKRDRETMSPSKFELMYASFTTFTPAMLESMAKQEELLVAKPITEFRGAEL